MNTGHDGSTTIKSNCNFFTVEFGRFSRVQVCVAGDTTLNRAGHTFRLAGKCSELALPPAAIRAALETMDNPAVGSVLDCTCVGWYPASAFWPEEGEQ